MPMRQMLRSGFLLSAAGLATWLALGTAESADTKAGGAGFTPVAPARLLLERAKALHKKVSGEIDGDAEATTKYSELAAEWLNVQIYREDKALSAWAKTQADLYTTIATSVAEDKAKAKTALKEAGKNWAAYEKNAKAWGNAKPATGDHKRLSKDLDFLMGVHKELAAQGTGKIDRAVAKNSVEAMAAVTEDLQLLAEMGNLLISDRPAPGWKKFAAALRDSSLHMIEVSDVNKLKPTLNEIHKACNDCHGGFRK